MGRLLNKLFATVYLSLLLVWLITSGVFLILDTLRGWNNTDVLENMPSICLTVFKMHSSSIFYRKYNLKASVCRAFDCKSFRAGRGQVLCVLLTLFHLSNVTVHKKTDLYVMVKSEGITGYQFKRRTIRFKWKRWNYSLNSIRKRN